MNANEFSEKLMKLSLEIQNAPRDKQKAFAALFSNAKQALTRLINVMKKYNKRLYLEFEKEGVVDVSYTGSLIRE